MHIVCNTTDPQSPGRILNTVLRSRVITSHQMTSVIWTQPQPFAYFQEGRRWINAFKFKFFVFYNRISCHSWVFTVLKYSKAFISTILITVKVAPAYHCHHLYLQTYQVCPVFQMQRGSLCWSRNVSLTLKRTRRLVCLTWFKMPRKHCRVIFYFSVLLSQTQLNSLKFHIINAENWMS